MSRSRFRRGLASEDPCAWCCPGVGRWLVVRAGAPRPHVLPAHFCRGPASTCIFLCVVALQNSLIKEGGLHQFIGQIDLMRVTSIFKNKQERTHAPKIVFYFGRNYVLILTFALTLHGTSPLSLRCFPVTLSRVTWCVLVKHFSSWWRRQRAPPRVGLVCGSRCRPPLRCFCARGSLLGRGMRCGFRV